MYNNIDIDYYQYIESPSSNLYRKKMLLPQRSLLNVFDLGATLFYADLFCASQATYVIASRLAPTFYLKCYEKIRLPYCVSITYCLLLNKPRKLERKKLSIYLELKQRLNILRSNVFH